MGVALVVALPLAAAAVSDGAFAYAPGQATPGASVEIVGKCLQEDSAAGVDLLVELREQVRDGFQWEQAFVPGADGSVRGQMVVPATAPAGGYLISGSCRFGRTAFYRRTAVFVVESATQVKGKTLAAPEDSGSGVRGLQVLVLLVGLGSAGLIGFGEWQRRRPQPLSNGSRRRVPALAQDPGSATSRPMHLSPSGRRSRPSRRRPNTGRRPR